MTRLHPRTKLLLCVSDPAQGRAWCSILRAQQFDITLRTGGRPDLSFLEGYDAILVSGMENLAAFREKFSACDRVDHAGPPVLAIITDVHRPARLGWLAAGFAEVMVANADAFELVARVRATLLQRTSILTLIIEDDEPIAAGLKLILEAAGHTCRMAATMEQARNSFSREPIDMLIVDRGLPDGDGLSFLAQIRAQGILSPALVLTARNHPSERVEGLRFGADDYIGKPFDEDEFLARIEVLLRPRDRDGRFICGPLEILRNDGIARWRGQRIALSDKEFRLLAYLAERHDLTVPVSMLRADVWGVSRQHSETNIIATGIRRLRRALDEAGIPGPHALIATEPNGYRFNLQAILESGDGG